MPMEVATAAVLPRNPPEIFMRGAAERRVFCGIAREWMQQNEAGGQRRAEGGAETGTAHGVGVVEVDHAFLGTLASDLVDNLAVERVLEELHAVRKLGELGERIAKRPEPGIGAVPGQVN